MSQFYDQASLVMIPSGYKNGKVYSQKPLSADGELTFTRASDATRVNADGLVEKVRTNYAPYGNDMSNWTQDLLVASSTADYWTLTDQSSSSAEHRIRKNSVIAVSGLVSFSSYFKAGTLNVGYLQIVEGSNNIYFYVNLTTGATNYQIGAGSGFVSVSSYDAGNGWYRLTATINASSSTFSLRLGMSTSMSNSFYTTSGGDTIFIKDIQLETGDIATQYIPTTTAAVSVGPVSGLPRLDYSGGCPSLLLEPQRTNLVKFSEQFDNATWNKTTGVIVTPNAAISPDGYQNADYIQMGAASRLISQATSLSVGVSCSASIYIKGTAGETIKIAAGGADSANIVLTGEWQHITHTATSITDGFNVNTFGGATARNFYIWGAQLEAGSYATSYIPTLGAAVTRLADSAYKTGISSLIGQTEGTMFAEFNAQDSTGAGQAIATIYENSSNVIILYKQNDNILKCFVVTAGTLVADLGSVSVSGNVKMAIAYKANDFALYINGTQRGVDTAGAVPACSNLYLGADDGGAQKITGKFSQALLFKTRLPNSSLEELTTL